MTHLKDIALASLVGAAIAVMAYIGLVITVPVQ